MKLISKKTPFIIAGAEIIRRQIKKAQSARKRKPRRKIALITGILGAAGAGAAVLAKRKNAAPQFDRRGHNEMANASSVVDLRQPEPTAGSAEG